MTEPVGNGPRSTIPANSHTAKEAAQAAAAPREPIEKVITGNARVIKTPWYRRVGQSMVADDAQTIGEHILFNIIIPSTKNLIRDVLVGTVDRTFYGSGVRSAAGPGGMRGTQGGIRQKYHEIASGPSDPRRVMSQSDRATHNFGNLMLDTRDEAIHVLNQLIDRINKYGSASVADFYDYCGVTTSDYAAQRWGWTDLLGTDVRQSRGGWHLVLPDPVVLRS